MTRKWIEVNDLLGGQQEYKVKNSKLRPVLWDYIDAYIVVKGTITVEDFNGASKRNKKLIFKNNAPFRSCISKIGNTLIDNAKDVALSLLKYSFKFAKH